MPFNTALSGIRAANDDLRLTGNNIANASTTGFKQSRAEFGDVYSTTVLGSGLNQIGSGVQIQDVAQQFSQGNISFTENVLDLAVSGGGFFVTNLNGDQNYTRAGTFGLDDEGYIVNNVNYRLQGFTATSSGNIDSTLGDIQIQTTSIQPRTTTGVDSEVNLDAREGVLQSTGTRFISSGNTAADSINGFGIQNLTFTNPDGSTSNITTSANDNSLTTANTLNSLAGVTATATADATITAWQNNQTVTINGATIANTDISQATATEISNLPGLTAIYDGTAGTLRIQSTIGDLSFAVTGGGADGNLFTVTGASGGTQTIENDAGADGVAGGNLDSDTASIVVGGVIQMDIDEGYSLTADTSAAPIFNNGSAAFVNNAFDPTDPNTYNHSTSVTIYDSLGNSHIMQQYFIKQPYDAAQALSPTNQPNRWQMAVQIDGQNVGEPTLAAPNTPTLATYDVYFDQNGTLDTALTSNMLISNWTPTITGNNSSQPLGPSTVAGGFPPEGPIPTSPISSSNFMIDLTGTTQVGSNFEVRAVDQNGLTSGRLAGINIDDTGVIFARYTNGENIVLAQVALADFSNNQGLQAVGDTSWAETSESGTPIIGGPGTSSLGLIQSGALEESNVELSEQLVNLIIAQRNFQASAKTIETADQTTQTIINLR
jgi:flagellar hook protein FlgE